MASNPAHFNEWLSGEFPYSYPPAWLYRITPDGVEIVPSRRPIVISGIMFFFVATFAPIIFWSCRGESDTPLLLAKLLIGGGVVVTMIIAFGFVLVNLLINYLKGPYLIYSSLNRCFTLPREHVVLGHSDVLRLRAVSGNWIGAEDAQKKRDDPVSELQLIVNDGGNAMAYLIVGSEAESIGAEAMAIAKAMELPIDIIVQHQGIVSAPTTSNGTRWRQM